MAMQTRTSYQFTGSLVPGLQILQGQCAIGNTGAVSAVKGNGIVNIVRLAAGVYQILMQQNYNRFLSVHASFNSPVTGSAILINGSSVMTIGTIYQITTVGTSTAAQWQAAGLPVNMVPTVGQTFAALTTGSNGGTGAVKALAVSSIATVEVAGDPQVMVNQLNPQIIIQTMAATSSSVTTLIPTDPVSGSVLHFAMLLRSSSIKGNGE